MILKETANRRTAIASFANKRIIGTVASNTETPRRKQRLGPMMVYLGAFREQIMANFKVKTGNLPEAVRSTVVKQDNKSAFVKYCEANKLTNGNRFSYVGYKITDKARAAAEKSGDSLPQNYSVQVPVLFDDLQHAIINDRIYRFVRDVLEDYQDARLHAIADDRADFDATSFEGLIVDYYDTTRSRDGFTQAVVLKWFDNVWSPAFKARKLEQNAENKAAGSGKIFTEQEITAIIVNHKPYIKALVRVEAGLDVLVLKNVKSTIERLIELEHLQQDDAIAQFIMSQCDAAMPVIQQILDTGV